MHKRLVAVPKRQETGLVRFNPSRRRNSTRFAAKLACRIADRDSRVENHSMTMCRTSRNFLGEIISVSN